MSIAATLLTAWIQTRDTKIENDQERRLALLEKTTTPRVDALIKLMVAFQEIIIPMFRPLGSLLMAAFGAYCLANNIELPDAVTTILFSAFPAWGVARQLDKRKDEEWDE